MGYASPRESQGMLKFKQSAIRARPEPSPAAAGCLGPPRSVGPPTLSHIRSDWVAVNHDGKPDEPGKDWWGTVSGFQPPGSLDFHHTITLRQLRATVDVHIHYSLEPGGAGTRVSRWLVLDIGMPRVLRPLRRLVTTFFDKENLRTMAAVAEYAEAHGGELADE